MASVEQVEPLIAAKCAELGLELFEARLFRAGSRSILRLFIDGPKGITVSDCEQVSNTVSLMLDVENFLNGKPYTLEVSSPGVDRPLKTARDFHRVRTREVTVNCREPVNGKLALSGIVQKCENNILYIEINGVITEISLDQILSGKEEIRFK